MFGGINLILAKKKSTLEIKAFCLGTDNPLEFELIARGKLRKINQFEYEVFSQEARGETGEIANIHDYVKIDSKGMPYPNKREFFLANHVCVGPDLYRQKSRPVHVWFADEEPDEVIRFLLNTKKLSIDRHSYDEYFSAELWGTRLSAPRNAAVVIYSAERDEHADILSVAFNFVERNEFERTYDLYSEL